jgi:hypothetical protein
MKNGDTLPCPPFQVSYDKRMPFPAGVRGFFYYFHPPHGILWRYGAIRFRITTSNDPSTFATGTDLLRPNTLPWQIPLIRIVGTKSCIGMRRLLVDDGSITEELMRQYWYPDSTYTRIKGVVRNRIIHSFGQLFDVDFRREETPIYVVTNGSCQKTRLRRLFDLRTTPFSGKSIR